MGVNKAENFKIIKATTEDLEKILGLFGEAMNLHGKIAYKVWSSIDKTALEKDIANGLQYKIEGDTGIFCIFSIQYDDPMIWFDKDQNDAIYLHRVVADPNFRGQRQFEKILNWVKNFARQKNLKFIRMDTWADNEKLIEYYK